MNLSALITIIAIAGGAIFMLGVVFIIRQASHHRPLRNSIALALLGLVIGIAFLSIRTGLVIVGATEVAVVFQSVGGKSENNSLWSEPLGPGAHIVVPGINTTIVYSTETRTYTMSRTVNEGAQSGDDSVMVRTSDAQQVYVDISVVYAVDPANVNALYLKYRQRYEEDFVRPIVRAVVRDIVSGYGAEDMYGPKRIEIQQKLNDELNRRFAGSGLLLKELLIRNITFSDVFINAIEAKQVAEQEAEKAKQEAERARITAQGKADAAVLQAQGDSDSAVAMAKGDAEATLLLSSANAKVLALINDQLKKNPLLLQWRYIESLAGDISLILLPGQGALPMAQPTWPSSQTGVQTP
jgi:regulator of protease activity HflC (stomatin/prohibitin superfamily)